jgi:hypothetical protein
LLAILRRHFKTQTSFRGPFSVRLDLAVRLVGMESPKKAPDCEPQIGNDLIFKEFRRLYGHSLQPHQLMSMENEMRHFCEAVQYRHGYELSSKRIAIAVSEAAQKGQS